MGDEGRKINRKWLLFYPTKKLTHVYSGTAAVSRHQRSHAHANKILGSRQVVNRFHVRMDVDEPRRYDLAPGINYLPSIGRINSANARDVPVLNTDVRAKPG